jgi:AcrR family transcriptional regulator
MVAPAPPGIYSPVMSSGPPVATYRERLLTALATVISRDGFNGAKIQDVVREAHVSLRTFYAEFDNKEECFLALYDHLGKQLDQLIIDAVSTDDPWHQRMQNGFQVYLNALALAPNLPDASLVELATLSDNARRVRQDALDRFIVLLIELVDQGRADNPDIPSRALTPMMARGISGAITEMTINFVVRGESERLPEIAPIAADLLWSVVTNVTPIPASALPLDAKTPKSGVGS